MRTVSQSSLRQAALRYYWRSGWPFLAWGVVIGLFLLLLVFVLPLSRYHDVRGAALMTGRGVVVGVIDGVVYEGNTDTAATISVRLAGQNVFFNTHLSLHKDEAVQVQYQVGRSGRVYENWVKPAGP